MYENRAALGYQDFEEVRVGHIFYIDKTDFIREWWEYADKVTLITRPRLLGNGGLELVGDVRNRVPQKFLG